jgi:hypothetical protein
MSNLTQTSAVMGTPYYMAPEQVAARKIDHRVDIFALGAIFYEMLTLEKPFSGENLTTVIYKIMNESPHPLREFQADVPPGLEPIIQKVLAKDPDARYQSCRDFINDLLHYAEANGMIIGDRFRARALRETQKMSKVGTPAGGLTRRPIPLIVGAMAVVVVLALGTIVLTRKSGPVPGREGEPKDDRGAVIKLTEKTDKTTPDPNADKGTKPEEKPADKPKTDAVTPDKNKTNPETPKVTATPKPPAELGDVEESEAALKKGDLRGAMDAAQRALRTNPGLDRAKAVLTAVIVQTAPGEIGSIINEYVVSLKANKLLAFYQNRCTPALYEKLYKNVDMMAKLYEDMDGVATRLTFDTAAAKYPNFSVRARFSHTITAKPKGKKNRETLFEGTYIWDVEKVNQRWILVDLVPEAR